MPRLFALVAALVCAVLSPVSAQNTEAPPRYAPAAFDESNGPLVFAADTRLDIGSTGTVEIGITLPRRADDARPQVQTLVAHESALSTAFRIQIGASGRRIGLFDGTVGSAVPFDFRAGGFFHIAMALREDTTQVFINGGYVGTLSRGVGPARAVPLFVGGQADGRNQMDGRVHYVRLWDIDLRQRDLSRLESVYGRPDASDPAAPYLAAYTQFTSAGQALLYRQDVPSEIVFTASAFGDETVGRPFSVILPPDGTVTQVGASYGTAMFGLMMNARTEAIAALTLSASGGAPPQVCPPAPEPCQIPALTAGRALVQPDERIVGLTGVTRDGTLRNVSLFTSQQRVIVLGGSGGTAEGAVPISLRIPDRARFAGYRGTFDEDGNIASLRLAYRQSVPRINLVGRWVSSLDPGPRKDTSAAARALVGGMHGDYTRPAVWSATTTDQGQTIRLATRGPTGADTLEFRLNADGRHVNQFGQALEVMDADTLSFGGNTLLRVQPYPRIDPRDSSFAAFGGTFDLDLQIPFTKNIFHGHDLGLINPYNLQDATALRKPVFRMPAADSRDFFPSYQKIVPFGLVHMPDVRERERSSTQAIKSAHDMATSLSRNVGISIGVPKIFSFSANASVAEQRDRQRESERQFSVTRDVRTERALVIDERHMQLDPGFRRHVLDLARDLRLGDTPNYAGLVLEYGTHYAHAMTVGTVSHKELQFTRQAYQSMYARQVSIQAAAQATIRGVDLGASGGQETGLSETVSQDLSNQREALDSVGSELEPVPVFLDLRPISDLLAPPYFDDVLIQSTIRDAISRTIPEVLALNDGANQGIDDIYQPYVYEIRLIRVGVGETPTDLDNAIVSPDPSDFTASLRIQLPDGTVRPFNTGMSANNAMTDANIVVERVFLSARQLCQGTRATISLDGTLTVDGATTTMVRQSIGFDFRSLNPQPQQPRFALTARDVAPNQLEFDIQLVRLPDLGGGFLEVPQCE